MSSINILLAGVGGQGTVLASKLIARCAMARGEKAHTAETIGMAQRGGCVTSHVRIGECFSPVIPLGGADAIIAFEPAEAVRCLGMLKKGGTVIVNTRAVKPVTDTLSKDGYDAEKMIEYLKNSGVSCAFVDCGKIAEACGSAKVINMALLGAGAALGAAGATVSEIEKVISTMPAKYREANIKALRMGAEVGRKEIC